MMHMGVPKADRKLMREINSMQVLQQIRVRGPISRPELAEATGLGLSTISNIVTELLDNKLVREVGEGDSSGGRRPGLLDINESARYAFGVKIGPEKVWISMFDLRARQIRLEEIALSQSETPETLFVQMSEVIDGMRRHAKLPRHSILGIGVSTSGVIDAATGACIYSPILGWENVPIRDRLKQLTKIDVVVENDVNAFAHGTLLQDANSLARNIICITTGPGVGAGIIIDRRLYRGSRGGAGEFGHVSIDRNGPLCRCGRRGCLEVLASDKFLMARAREIVESGASIILPTVRDERELSPTTIFYAAQLGDEAARALYRELGENLGYGVANLINLFNPDKIVIGGEGAVASKFFIDALRETATKYAFPHLADQLEIVVDDGSEDVWLQGAALLVIEKFFEVPLSNQGPVVHRG
jgi:glucokinase-like ROK family protein